MMNDFAVICCIGLLVLAFLAFMAFRALGSGLGNLFGGNRGGTGGGNPFFGGTPRGTETPRYDDPNIESRGSFGRDKGNSSTGMGGVIPRFSNRDDNLESGGKSSMPPSGMSGGSKTPFSGDKSGGSSGFSSGKSSGSGSKSFGSSKESGSGGRADSPDIQSRGGFGRDKD